MEALREYGSFLFADSIPHLRTIILISPRVDQPGGKLTYYDIMKRNELLSNRAYLPHSPNISRRDFLSPHKQDKDIVKFRHDSRNGELSALENNIRNTLEIKMKNEYEQIVNQYLRENNNLKEHNKELQDKLNEYEQKIAGLYAQVEIKKAVRQNRKANLEVLRKGPGMP